MDSQRVWRIVFVPAVITLAVTLLRLVGELRQWSRALFNPSAGGGAALVGIVWLAFVFSIYFAVRLQNEGAAFGRRGRAVGLAFLALAVMIGGMFLMVAGGEAKVGPALFASFAVLLASHWLMRLAWPEYWNVMLAYALTARIPVIVVMFFAVRGNWNTHYDVAPGMQFSNWVTKFVLIGLIPQLAAWIPFTVVFCGLFGVLTAALRKRRGAVAP